MREGLNRSPSRFPVALALALVAILGIRCGDAETSGGGSGLPDGQWAGDYIDFTVSQGEISEVTLHNIFCAKPHPEHAFLNACTSKPVEGSYPTGLAIEDLSLIHI